MESGTTWPGQSRKSKSGPVALGVVYVFFECEKP